MKKRVLALLMIMLLVISVTACGSSQQNQEETQEEATTEETEETGEEEPADASNDPAVTLRYATHMSSTSDTGVLLQSWLDQMSADSGGSITVEPYWQASLVAPINAYAETSAGVTDLMTAAPGNETDHFILETALTYMYCGQLPNEKQIEVAHELWEQVPEWQEEFSEVEVLGFGSAGNSFHILSTKPIKTLDDIKGLDIRVMEQWAFDLMQDLGANPVKMPLGEMYEGLQKGVIDGVLLCESHYLSENLTEYIKYMTDLRITPAPCVWTYINKDVFDGLTANQQEVVKNASAESEAALVSAYTEWDTKSAEAAEGNSVERFSITDEELATIIQIAQENAQEQVKKLDDAGYDGTGIYEKLQSLIDARK